MKRPPDGLSDRTRARVQASNLVACAGLAASCLAVYANSFSAPFIFDDRLAIVENPTIRSLWPLTPVLFSATFASVAGRPILNLSLAINYALGGTHVWGYHLANLLFHLSAGLLLFGVLRRTLTLPVMQRRFETSATTLSFVIAAIWLVHPLQTESVTYIIQRSESMVGVFYLLTLYCVIRAASAARPGVWNAVAIAACVLGMGTKEVMATAPLVVLAYDSVFLSGSLRRAFRRSPGLYAGLAASWLVLGSLMVSSGQREGSAGFGLGVTAVEYARSQLVYIIHYLRLSVWPDPLVLDYGVMPVGAVSMRVLLSAGIVLSLVALTIGCMVRWPKVGFLGFCFFILLAPTSSIVPLAGQIAAERRMYLPLALVIAIVVLALHHWWHRTSNQDDRLRGYGRAAGILATIVVVLPLAGRTWMRNREYQSPLKVWQIAVRAVPDNPRAHLSVGACVFGNGDASSSLEHFSRAIDLEPRYGDAFFNRGTARQQLGDLPGALADFDRCIELMPRHAAARVNRGAARMQLQLVDDALRDFEAAIVLEPDNAQALYNRGVFRQLRNEHLRAIDDYTRAIELRRDYAEAYLNRALVYQLMQNPAMALKDLDSALTVRPDYAPAFGMRGTMHLIAGRYVSAVQDCTRAVQLNPSTPSPYTNRAMAYFYLRQFDEAWSDVQKARSLGAQLDPKFLQDLTEKSGRQR